MGLASVKLHQNTRPCVSSGRKDLFLIAITCMFLGFSGKTDVWTGWNDIREEGNLLYLETSSISRWTNWDRNQPDGGSDENCVVAHGGDFRWHDYPCDAKHLPLCHTKRVL